MPIPGFRAKAEARICWLSVRCGLVLCLRGGNAVEKVADVQQTEEKQTLLIAVDDHETGKQRHRQYKEDITCHEEQGACCY